MESGSGAFAELLWTDRRASRPFGVTRRWLLWILRQRHPLCSAVSPPSGRLNRAGTVVVMDPQTGRVFSIVNQQWAIRETFSGDLLCAPWRLCDFA